MARYQKMMWMVECVKLKSELPALDRPPFPGELGQRIFDNISKAAWAEWKEHSVLLINHYGLNLADPEAQQFMTAQMETFLFSDGAELPEGFSPQQGKGTPQRK
jgi:Fe-S cluster biosynthesis and repair protein YggX